MRAHPNAERLAAGFAAFASGDLEALRALFAADVAWTIPGESPYAGTVHGLPAVLELLAGFVAASGGSYRAEPLWVVADDEHAVARYRASGSREGRTLAIEQALLCRFEDGLVVEVLALPTDQIAFDDFWR